MATGMAIMGFGGGAMIAKVTIDRLLAKFYKVPEFLGETDSVNLITEGGRRFVDVSGALVEVVVVTVNDIAKMIVPGDPGVYIVGTGSSGSSNLSFSWYRLLHNYDHCSIFLQSSPLKAGLQKVGHHQKILKKPD